MGRLGVPNVAAQYVDNDHTRGREILGAEVVCATIRIPIGMEV